MKKKVFLFLLLIIGVFTLTGCVKEEEKETKPSKNDIIKKATELDINTLNNDIYENKAKAEKDYIGNYYKVSGYVLEIESDYVSLSASDSYTGRIKAYLPKEELVDLKKDYKVTIVGKITDFKEEDHGSYFDSFVIMKNAYYITNEFEIEGVVDYCGTIEKGFYCKTQSPVYYIHVSQEQAVTYDEKGKKIRVKGNIPKEVQYGYPRGINIVNVQFLE